MENTLDEFEEDKSANAVYTALSTLMSHIAARPNLNSKFPIAMLKDCSTALQRFVAAGIIKRAKKEAEKPLPSKEAVQLLDEWYKLWVTSDLPNKLPHSLHTRTAMFLSRETFRTSNSIPVGTRRNKK